MADAPAAPPGVDERLQLPQVPPPPGMLRVEAEPVEPGPVGQQRRDHRGNPAGGRVGHEADVPAQQAAVESLVELAQVGGGHGVVVHGRPMPEEIVPKSGPFRHVRIAARAVGVGGREAGQRRIGHGHRGEDAVLGLPRVERPQPRLHLVEVGFVAQGGHGLELSRHAVRIAQDYSRFTGRRSM